ncbi:unnamed protein product [Brassica rapa]|uniref:Uncharacterized protein n=2 Tax=Brassica TaxID=3705 RepID=A0A3P6CU55_BRACM|nr:unnamed protein product [Brassica napus]CAG7909377.1 unnamed protein product [Brassica rapa]VDD17128.1 unnamed protein product [Brassica rapa]
MFSKQLYIPYGKKEMQSAMEMNLLQQTDLFTCWIGKNIRNRFTIFQRMGDDWYEVGLMFWFATWSIV